MASGLVALLLLARRCPAAALMDWLEPVVG